MNIEKNKTFLLKLPEFNETLNAILTSKEDKEYLLITLEDKRIFKICLSAKNEFEYYDDEKILTLKIRDFIVNMIFQLNPTYSFSDFNYEIFFTNSKFVKFNRNEIDYSLYVEEPNDYLKNYDFIGKIIEINSSFFKKITSVFIFRKQNKIFYSILVDAKKIVKYEFEINNDSLNLINEERYNEYQNIEFLNFIKDFKFLVTTSHEMQKDIKNSDSFFISMYQEIFSV